MRRDEHVSEHDIARLASICGVTLGEAGLSGVGIEMGLRGPSGQDPRPRAPSFACCLHEGQAWPQAPMRSVALPLFLDRLTISCRRG